MIPTHFLEIPEKVVTHSRSHRRRRSSGECLGVLVPVCTPRREELDDLAAACSAKGEERPTVEKNSLSKGVPGRERELIPTRLAEHCIARVSQVFSGVGRREVQL